MRILVEMLKERGDILRFTRSGIDDGPALMNDDFFASKIDDRFHLTAHW